MERIFTNYGRKRSFNEIRVGKKELGKLLNISDCRVKLIDGRNQVVKDELIFIKDRGYFEINGGTQEYYADHRDLQLSDIKPIRKDNYRGWACILRGTNMCRKNIPKVWNVPSGFSGTFPYVVDGKTNYCFNIGHILAKSFFSFIEFWYIDEINDPDKNLFTQFSSANINSVEKMGQSFVEDRVLKLLKEKRDVVFYEVKILYRCKKDKIPVGTEIYYYSELLKNEEHVFIPNFDEDFDLSSMNDSNRLKSYREFYKEGCKTEYKKYLGEKEFLNYSEFFYVKKAGRRAIYKKIEDVFKIEKSDDNIECLSLNEILKNFKHAVCYPLAQDDTNCDVEAIFIDWMLAEYVQKGHSYKSKSEGIKEALERLEWNNCL